jgi:hypothetical protein
VPKQQMAVLPKQKLLQQQTVGTVPPGQVTMPPRLCGSIITTGRITTRAGSGMQSRPPSRNSSLRGALDLQAQQQHSISISSSCRRALPSSSGRGHALTADSAPAAAGTPAPKIHSSSTGQLPAPSLLVSGTSVHISQQQQPLQRHFESALATRQHSRMVQQHLVCDVKPCRRPGSTLGCGVAWSQLVAQAALVAKRSLHHTKGEQEQQR